MRKALLIRGIASGLVLLPAYSTIPAPLQPVAYAAPAASSELQSKLDAFARRSEPGILGVVVLDFESGRSWGVHEERTFPMMSVFKAPLAAAVLAKVDRGEISLQQGITLTRADLRAGASRIARDFKGGSMTFSVGQLLTDAVSRSDNTAADALIQLLGGPLEITSFLRAHDIEGMRVDLDERGVDHVFSGLGDADRPPADETAEQRDARLQRGYRAFLDDPRNRSTPRAATTFLKKLWHGELLSTQSTRHLLDLMYGQTVPVRLRAGLPAGVRFADKCGTSVSLGGVTAAFNDIGILTWPDGRTIVVAAFLAASRASRSEREALFADLARETAAALHP